MTRGIIARTYTRRRGVLMLTLLAALAMLTATCMANSASAATDSKISSERSLYQSANADPPSSGEVSTLTNNVEPRGSAERQLPLGIGLLAVGLVGLVYGLAVIFSTPSPSPTTTP
jgi:hypothetical protein